MKLIYPYTLFSYDWRWKGFIMDNMDNMDAVLHRHDITDREWEILAPHLPGKPGDWGGVAKDNRAFINGVKWILRTGVPWRDLPSVYGKWSNTHRRFCRWRDRGVWRRVFEALIDDPDFEWLMIDATYVKAHKHACGGEGGDDAISLTKGG